MWVWFRGFLRNRSGKVDDSSVFRIISECPVQLFKIMIVHKNFRNAPINTITNPHPTPLRLLLTLLCILNFSSIWWECPSVSQLEKTDSPKPTSRKAPFCNTCHFNDTGKEEADLAFASVQLRCLYIQAIDFHDVRHMIQWIIFL